MVDADDDDHDAIPSHTPQEKPAKRVRMSASLDPETRAWLRRIAMSHAHLQYIVRLFGRPETAGGQSREGETYAARASRGDRTLLYDAVGYVGDELAELRQEIAARMGSAPTTTALPGTADKVRTMCERAEQGFDLFIAGDTPIDVR
jgi:hypothetical protein